MKTREIAEFLSGVLHGSGDIEVDRVADIKKAGEGGIAFIEDASKFNGANASCLIVPNNFDLTQFDLTHVETRGAGSVSCFIHVQNPKLAFARIAEILHPPKSRKQEIHPNAVIAANASVGKDVFVGAFTVIGENSTVGDGTQLRAGAKLGDGVSVGKNCVLHPNVFVEDGCTIGDKVILHAGVVIGADGFGYVRDDSQVEEERTTPSAKSGHPSFVRRGAFVKFPQIGTVVIEDNVEIGANSCVDRGALGETRIGMGTKIDNLVQVGHNVQIGKRCVIAAQTGISGSVVIEDDCVIGGQVGFGDHAHVQSGAVIGSQAGVLPGKIVRPGVWWGTPIQPLDEFKRLNAHFKGLARLKEEIKELKRQIAELTAHK